ncbi:12069_t:CDS:2 [Funneliformis geosporum]|nr:12069_t:CDS:2 [Funneliformis geosporum]
MSWDSYFDETSPNQYRFLGFYKHRQNQQNFTFSFRKEADILRKSLDLLIKDNRSEDIKKEGVKLTQLRWKPSCFPPYGLLVRCGLPQAVWETPSSPEKGLNSHNYGGNLIAFYLMVFLSVVKHRFHNEDVNNFWNEIELMYNNKEKQRLESERSVRTCHVNISNKTQCMMENIAEETAEAHLATTKKRSTGKRKSICYSHSHTESSKEEDHSSDPDYIEKPRRNKKPRSNRSRRKVERDGMDKDDIIEETSEDKNTPSSAQLTMTSNISEDTTLVETSPSTLQAQPTITSLNNSEDIAQSTPQQTPTSFDMSEYFSTSRESTPCPVVQPTQQVLINTPNKPVVTKVMCDKYSPYLVCVFSATINHVKETIDEGTYREIEKLFLMKNRLVLQESFVKKLESIFETDYAKIESKIINETIVEGDNQSEVARFNFFVRYTLLDFTANFKYRLPRVLDRDMSERTFIVECLSPIFRAFRNAFPEIKYDWIEKNVTSIREANNMFAVDISPRKTDLFVVRLSDGMEILNTEVSGPPFKATISHTVGDVKKLLMMSICSLCRIFGNNLDCSAKDAKGIKTYNIQVVGDRLTLFSVSITDQKKYLAVELASCMIPFSFDSISYYTKIFNFFAIIQAEFKEQEKLRKKIYSSISIENTERIRDWLYLPEDSFLYDLNPIPEDIDEILMI